MRELVRSWRGTAWVGRAREPNLTVLLLLVALRLQLLVLLVRLLVLLLELLLVVLLMLRVLIPSHPSSKRVAVGLARGEGRTTDEASILLLLLLPTGHSRIMERSMHMSISTASLLHLHAWVLRWASRGTAAVILSSPVLQGLLLTTAIMLLMSNSFKCVCKVHFYNPQHTSPIRAS